MGLLIDLTGQSFDRWTVVDYSGSHKKRTYWSCICDCGNTGKIEAYSLKKERSRSCGCFGREKAIKDNTSHGQGKRGEESKEYRCWRHMKDRCYSPKDGQYHNYGARGITVCERWRKFENFFEDMGKCPEGLTIERVNNDGNYEPGNCKWATKEEQMNNTRRNRWVKHKGITKTLTQWARVLNMSESTLRARLKKDNWATERAFSIPVGEIRCRHLCPPPH